ncbi:MAG TPA: Gfo/Idh/MocA family oxidoreductase [Verrucomicrobiales bacterium]|nr:Gfo/Idh/MocA family oxidoreductase [Verrucomicrobiales bacterium]
MKQVSVSQIGVGYWGPNLLRNLIHLPGFRVEVVVDPDPKRRKYVQEMYPGTEVAADPEAALNNPRIDALVVATPAATHFPLVLSGLNAGKHVLVEKPMATSVREVDAIEEAARRTERVAMVGHTFLYNPAVRRLKAMIDSGELGDIRYLYSQRLNLGLIRSDVDALWNLAPHDISILQYLLDDRVPVSVRRMGSSYIQSGIDDVVFLHLEYPGNVMGHVHVSWLDPHKVRRLTVVGSRKMAVYDDVSEYKLAIYDKGIDQVAKPGNRMDYDVPMTPYLHRSGDVYLPHIEWQEPLRAELQHFHDCIVEKQEPLTGCSHAREVVRILETGGTPGRRAHA